MGLWLKCPGCQAQNPLPLKVCPLCGQDLDKLPAAKRVYVMGPAAAPPRAPVPAEVKPPAEAAASQPVAPSPEAVATPKPAKKPRKAKKKKS
jgi:hypothetical protein